MSWRFQGASQVVCDAEALGEEIPVQGGCWEMGGLLWDPQLSLRLLCWGNQGPPTSHLGPHPLEWSWELTIP